MQRKCSALKADEHPGACLGCYYIDLFEWDFFHVLVIERTADI